METRTFNIELRNKEDRQVTGNAAVYNQVADIGWFREEILPGAFNEAIDVSDIRALFNHNPDRLLARKKAGGSSQDTLTVNADNTGLRYSFDMPSHGDDILEMINRGDLTQNSFAFTVAEDGDRWETKDGITTRTITKVEKLYDISPVTYPAYVGAEIDTKAAKRSFEKWQDNGQNTGDSDGNIVEGENRESDSEISTLNSVEEVDKKENPTNEKETEEWKREIDSMRRYLDLREKAGEFDFNNF